MQRGITLSMPWNALPKGKHVCEVQEEMRHSANAVLHALDHVGKDFLGLCELIVELSCASW